MLCINLLTLPPLLFCKFPCGHSNFGIRIQGGLNATQQHSRMCTVPPTIELQLCQVLRPLQAVNNWIGRSEQGEEVEAWAWSFSACTARRVYLCILSAPLHRATFPISQVFQSKGSYSCQEGRAGDGRKVGALPLQLAALIFGG